MEKEKIKIIIADDNLEFATTFEKYLNEEEDMEVIAMARDGIEAYEKIIELKPDIVLLDIIMPNLDGIGVLEKLNESGFMPTCIMLSAVGQDMITKKALALGASYYIVKPFEPKELLARIKVQLRMKNSTENKELKYKDMFLDKMTHTLYIENKKINLTKTEYTILKQLLLNPKQIITKTKLIQILNENNKVSTKTQLYDENSLKVHISNIRKKIRNVTTNEYIESVWGIGFKLYD